MEGNVCLEVKKLGTLENKVQVRFKKAKNEITPRSLFTESEDTKSAPEITKSCPEITKVLETAETTQTVMSAITEHVVDKS